MASREGGGMESAEMCIRDRYYCVIGGWVIKFAWAFLTGSGNAAAADDYFSNFIARSGEPVMWLVFFILATSVVKMCIRDRTKSDGKIIIHIRVRYRRTS